MRVGVVFGSLGGMVCRVQPVSMSNMGVVRSLFVVLFDVVFGSFAVVGRSMLVMFSSFIVMLRGFVVVHRDPLSWRNWRSRQHCRLRAVIHRNFRHGMVTA